MTNVKKLSPAISVENPTADLVGLAVYGADFGRYPLGPTIIINFLN
jgi:hypothetical protein